MTNLTSKLEAVHCTQARVSDSLSGNSGRYCQNFGALVLFLMVPVCGRAKKRTVRVGAPDYFAYFPSHLNSYYCLVFPQLWNAFFTPAGVADDFKSGVLSAAWIYVPCLPMDGWGLNYSLEV